MTRRVYLLRGDSVTGPLDAKRIAELHRRGKLRPSDRVGRSPEGPWLALAQALQGNRLKLPAATAQSGVTAQSRAKGDTQQRDSPPQPVQAASTMPRSASSPSRPRNPISRPAEESAGESSGETFALRPAAASPGPRARMSADEFEDWSSIIEQASRSVEQEPPEEIDDPLTAATEDEGPPQVSDRPFEGRRKSGQPLAESQPPWVVRVASSVPPWVWGVAAAALVGTFLVALPLMRAQQQAYRDEGGRFGSNSLDASHQSRLRGQGDDNGATLHEARRTLREQFVATDTVIAQLADHTLLTAEQTATLGRLLDAAADRFTLRDPVRLDNAPSPVLQLEAMASCRTLLAAMEAEFVTHLSRETPVSDETVQHHVAAFEDLVP